MSTYLVKLHKNRKDYYLEWSTAVNAPISHGMSLKDLREYYRGLYGNKSIGLLNNALQLARKKGCSALRCTLQDLLESNSAGYNGEHLTKDEIIERYCI